MVDFNALVPWRNNKSEVATKRDDYFDPFVSFRREMDRMFDRFFDGLPASNGTGWQALTPAVDVDETDKEMVITADRLHRQHAASDRHRHVVGPED
jgi:HSP20 family molecular chaperone IbpA